MPIPVKDVHSYERNDDGLYIVWTSRLTAHGIIDNVTYPRCEMICNPDSTVKHFNPLTVLGETRGVGGGHFNRDKAMDLIRELEEKGVWFLNESR